MDLTASSPRHVARVARAFRLALWLAMSTTLALGAQEKKQEKAKKEKEPADSAKVAKWKQEADKARQECEEVTATWVRFSKLVDRIR